LQEWKQTSDRETHFFSASIISHNGRMEHEHGSQNSYSTRVKDGRIAGLLLVDFV
jgi:hypothetical protein